MVQDMVEQFIERRTKDLNSPNTQLFVLSNFDKNEFSIANFLLHLSEMKYAR